MKRSIFNMGVAVCLIATASPGWAVDRAVPGTFATIAAALAAAQSGDRIVITGQIAEDAALLVNVDNLTLTSGATRADIRQARFTVNSQNVTFQGVDINGNSPGGVRSTNAVDLVTLGNLSNNITFIDCKIVNPALGTGDGGSADTDETQHSNPGTCVEVRTPGPLTIQNCNFVCDDYTEGTGSQNIVNLHFRGAIGAVGPVLIEDSTFACERRCLDFQAGWSNITVRRCQFRNYGTGSGASAGIYLFPDDVAAEEPITNLTIQDCNFLGNQIGARGIYAPSVRTANVSIRNCNFTSANMATAIRWIGRGEGPVIDNCVIQIGTRQGIGATGGFSGNVFYPKMDPQGFIHGFTVSNCVISGNDNAGIVFEWNVVDGIVIENNTLSGTGREGIGFFERPCSVLVRGNDITACGQSGPFVGSANGGIVLAVNDSIVTDNFIINCPAGIIPRVSRAGAGDPSVPQTERHPRNLTISRNIVILSGGSGITDDSLVPASSSDAQGTYRGRSMKIRYFNNTVVNSQGFNMVVNGDANEVYNNILVGGGGGLTDAGGSGNATFLKFGFNLRFNSGYQNIPNVPTTDIVANAQLTGGAFPSSRAGAVPLPSSPALRAGTTNGVDPDYVTDIGAIQVGAVTDTSVGATAWDLYR